MRKLEFDFLYATKNGFLHKHYTLDEIVAGQVKDLSNEYHECALVAKRLSSGLTDQAEEILFDGDIIQYQRPLDDANRNVWVIEWDDERARFFAKRNYWNPSRVPLSEIAGKCLKIGNIFEHKTALAAAQRK